MGEINNLGKSFATLAELLEKIDELDDEATIYAEAQPNWTESSPSFAIVEPIDKPLPADDDPMQYLLEVELAKEVLEAWSECRNGRIPSIHEKCEAVIFYAENDAYLPPSEENNH